MMAGAFCHVIDRAVRNGASTATYLPETFPYKVVTSASYSMPAKYLWSLSKGRSFALRSIYLRRRFDTGGHFDGTRRVTNFAKLSEHGM